MELHLDRKLVAAVRRSSTSNAWHPQGMLAQEFARIHPSWSLLREPCRGQELLINRMGRTKSNAEALMSVNLA